MTRSQEKALERDLPAVALRCAVLDAVDAHKAGVKLDQNMLIECRLLLGGIISEQAEGKAA